MSSSAERPTRQLTSGHSGWKSSARKESRWKDLPCDRCSRSVPSLVGFDGLADLPLPKPDSSPLRISTSTSYGVKFFASAGIRDSFLIQVVLGAVNVVSTFPGLLAVEMLGRRQTLLIGSCIMFTGQVVAGALGTAYPDGEVAGKILITFSCIFIFGFASSWG